LPIFFYNNLTQVHLKTWENTQDGFCTVKTGIGQEFITELTERGEDWLRELFLKNQKNIYREEMPAANRGIKELNFQEYLTQKHILREGEMKIQSISVKQYMNRLESMRRHGIYNEENQIDSTLVGKIQGRYKDWKTYVKTIEHYFNF
jgi:hypothetical protein